MLTGANIIVLDLETARSADDCRYCGREETAHVALSGGLLCARDATTVEGSTFTAIGWNNKPALGLSVGCYYDYQNGRAHWFDVYTLEETVRHLVARHPLLVSFNGIGFDFVLMRGLLRRYAEGYGQGEGSLPLEAWAQDLVARCDTFKAHCAASYDLLAQIWRADPSRKFERGLNSLDAIAQANGFGAKLSHGAQAPRDWRDGYYARVLNYCQDDVYKTKALFELVVQRGGLLRGDGQWLALPAPDGVAVPLGGQD